MESTTLRLMLLCLTVYQGNAVCTKDFVPRPSSTLPVVQLSPSVDSILDCQYQCTSIDYCYGYTYNPFDCECNHIFYQFDEYDIKPANYTITLYIRHCTPPPTTTTTTTRGTPPSTTTTPCPPVEGLGTNLVVLIAVGAAVGGLILGMLLVAICCHGGSGCCSGDAPQGSYVQSSCNSCSVKPAYFNNGYNNCGGQSCVVPASTCSVAFIGN